VKEVIRSIRHGDEWFALHADGCISRPAIKMGPSGQWKVTGAVERNNFGGVVRRYSLAQILDDPTAIPWKFKNGKQRVFIQDLDHGTHREWASPGHYVS
jgi:hypothetical protein